MDTSDAGDNQANRSTFRGFGNESHSLAQNLVDTRRAAYRPHPNDREIDDLGEASPAKRRRLTQVPLSNGNENQRRSSTEYDLDYWTNAETDTESDADANDSVKMKRVLRIEQMDLDETDAAPLSQPKKPKMYFDWLDKKTLVKIFDQLDLYDLLQMADEDTRIAQIIGEEIMPSRVLNIPEISSHYSVRHAFKHFGRFVSEVVINQSDIQWKNDELSEVEEIFRLIEKRCSDGKLKKLSIAFDMKDKNAYELRTEIPECIKALKSLTITQGKRRIKRGATLINIDHCLESLLINCTELKSLVLNGIKLSGQFLTALNVIKLQELTFDDCRFSEFTYWLKFVKTGIPSLKSFGWNNLVVDGIKLFEVIFIHISTAFRQLERLSFYAGFNLMAKFIQFVKLPQNPLKALHLRCFLEDNYVRDALSQMCYLQELHIEIIGWHSWYYRPTFKEGPISWENTMQRLTEVKVFKFSTICSYIEWNRIINWVTNLPKVRRVDFKTQKAIGWKIIKNIVSCLPKIDTLKLDVPIKSITPKFYNTLVSDRSVWHRNSPELWIYMDAGKVNSLKKTVVDYVNKAKCIRLCPLSET